MRTSTLLALLCSLVAMASALSFIPAPTGSCRGCEKGCECGRDCECQGPDYVCVHGQCMHESDVQCRNDVDCCDGENCAYGRCHKGQCFDDCDCRDVHMPCPVALGCQDGACVCYTDDYACNPECEPGCVCRNRVCECAASEPVARPCDPPCLRPCVFWNGQCVCPIADEVARHDG